MSNNVENLWAETKTGNNMDGGLICFAQVFSRESGALVDQLGAAGDHCVQSVCDRLAEEYPGIENRMEVRP